MGVEGARGLPAGRAGDDELDAALLREGTGERRLAGSRVADEQHPLVHRRPGDLARLAHAFELVQAQAGSRRDVSKTSLHALLEERESIVRTEPHPSRLVE